MQRKEKKKNITIVSAYQPSRRVWCHGWDKCIAGSQEALRSDEFLKMERKVSNVTLESSKRGCIDGLFIADALIEGKGHPGKSGRTKLNLQMEGEWL